MTSSVVRFDRAVRKIKALPKNRNVPCQKTVYRCNQCHTFSSESSAEAWTHSFSMHGPWPVEDSAALTPLRTSEGLSYNREERIVALSGGPNVRRVQ